MVGRKRVYVFAMRHVFKTVRVGRARERLEFSRKSVDNVALSDGTDDAVVANLTALARAGVPIVTGSVTSSREARKRMIAQTRFQLFARGLKGFAPLAERSGYAIAESRTAVVSEQVLLRPRATVPPSQ